MIKKSDLILGIDAGGQTFKFSLLKYSNLKPLFEPIYTSIDSNGSKQSILDVWNSIIKKAMKIAEENNGEIKLIGCSCPGPFDYYNGISLMDHKWKSIKGVNLPKTFYENGLNPKIPVFFCHDAHSLVFGEIASGRCKSFSTVGGFIIGSGLGFGTVSKGSILADTLGTPIFRMFCRPFRNETIEDFAASRGIPRLFKEITGRSTELSAKEIGDLANKGDEKAILAYRKMGEAIATVSSKIIEDYKIDCLIFGGRISNSFDVFIPAFKEELERKGTKIPLLLKSQNSEMLSIIGASYYGKKQKENIKNE